MDVTVRTRGIGPRSAFVERALARSKPELRRRLVAVAADAEATVEAKVEAKYERRSGDRHKAGQTHLHGSFHCEVVETGDGRAPFRLRLWSDADPRHVGALEFGSPPHEITPSTAQKLVFPWATVKTSSPFGRTRRGGTAVLDRVWHPGTSDSGAGEFMKDSLEEAVERAFSKAVRARRT